MFCRPSRGIVVLIINFVFYHIYGIFSIHCPLGCILYYIILCFFAALLRCTSYNGNAIFSGNQSISTVLAELDGSRRTRRFSQDSTVRANRTRRFAQDSTARAGLDGSRRQNSTVRAGLDGSRRTRRFAQDSTVLADRTRRFAQDSTGFAVSSPFWPLRRLIYLLSQKALTHS